jgi:hypothetical protein
MLYVNHVLRPPRTFLHVNKHGNRNEPYSNRPERLYQRAPIFLHEIEGFAHEHVDRRLATFVAPNWSTCIPLSRIQLSLCFMSANCVAVIGTDGL